VSRGNSTGLGYINILLDLSFTKDYRMLLCMIGMMEKMLGLWDTNFITNGHLLFVMGALILQRAQKCEVRQVTKDVVKSEI